MPRLRTALFINAHSRRASRVNDKVVKDFTMRQDSLDVVKVIEVHNLRKVKQHLRELQEIDNLQAVIVGGGDGTIVGVLNALKDRDVVYGFLPLGTSNTFVKSLGLPMQYPLARRLILKGQTRKASVGAVDGKVFANIAGIGIPARVSTATTNKIKKVLGPVAYVVNGFREALTHRAFYCQVTNDQINESFYTHYLLFANGEYHGPLSLGKEVSAYNDQLMLIAIGTSEKRRHGLASIVSVFFRRHEKDNLTKMIPFTRALVTTRPSRSIEADGEIIGSTPATIEVRKEAITVFAKPPKAPRAAKTKRTRTKKPRPTARQLKAKLTEKLNK